MSDENTPTIEIQSGYFPEELLNALKVNKDLPDDFTLYLKNDDQNSLIERLGLKKTDNHIYEPFCMKIQLCGEEDVKVRALLCLCYENRLWSISFRKLDEKKSEKDLKGRTVPAAEWKTGYTPGTNRKKNLNSLSELCQILAEEIFPEKDGNKPDSHGLILVTGATASAKSQVTRGLIDHYLQRSLQIDKRRSHLVTFEDPIEKYFVDLDPAEREDRPFAPYCIPAHIKNIDYTPREKGKGVDKLERALADALRQTPKIFYVGETREEEDWKELIKFAGSGHLIITTAHAGSLVESMQLMFKANKVNSASERNHIANRIRAIVHMKKQDHVIHMGGDKVGTSVLLPSMWLGTPTAINNLTATGLSSLCPGGKDSNALGRKYFARKLLEKAEQARTDPDEKGLVKTLSAEEFENLKEEVIKKALVFDLKGE